MLNYPTNLMGGKEYWSATEASATECYAVVKVKEDGGDYWPKKFSKQESFYVRCVRDKNKPKPQK